jgi:hypothetical protein
MYASVTSYGDIYDQAYRDRRGETTSFSKSILPELLVKYCRSEGLSGVLDISGGQGYLARRLHSQGLRAITTDLVANPSAGIFGLDISSYSEPRNRAVLNEAKRAFGGEIYLTSCFDVLEHIDIEHLFSAIRNLHAVTANKLVVSISTRPSVFNNRFHSTLLPLRTWIRLFSEAGFRVLKTDHFRAATSRPNLPDTPDLKHVRRWNAVDLFADIKSGEPQYVVFENAVRSLNWQTVEERFNKILDLGYRIEKRRLFNLPKGEHICFNLGFAPDWAHVRPFLDVLPRSQVEFVIRKTYFSPFHLDAIIGFLTRMGIKHRLFESPGELAWDKLAGTTFISASESTANSPHVQSHHAVAVARLHGCRTITLQHGIWPGAMKGRIVTYASEHLLNWTSEEETALTQGRHRILEADVPWGVFHPGQVKTIGSARYADQLLPPGEDAIEFRLGIDRNRFDRVVLLGSKNLKSHGYENLTDGFYGKLRCLIESRPATLFLLRPHPFDEIDPFVELKADNVRLLDDACCIMADIQLNRVIPHVDLVATPISTLAVDGAVSSKPVYIYATDRPLVYKGAKPRAFEDLVAAIGDSSKLAILQKEAAGLAAVYADGANDQFYTRLSDLLTCPGSVDTPDAALAATISLCDEARFWREEYERKRQALESILQESVELKETVVSLEHQITSLRSEVAIYQHRLARTVRSRVARALQRAMAKAQNLVRLQGR